MSNLMRFSLIGAYYVGEERHAQVVMSDLGIKYQHSTPQSISDEWWFWNVSNLPEELPPFLSFNEVVNPYKYVGWGLTEEMADNLQEIKDE